MAFHLTSFLCLYRISKGTKLRRIISDNFTNGLIRFYNAINFKPVEVDQNFFDEIIEQSHQRNLILGWYIDTERFNSILEIIIDIFLEKHR